MLRLWRSWWARSSTPLGCWAEHWTQEALPIIFTVFFLGTCPHNSGTIGSRIGSMPWMSVPPLKLFALAQVGDSRLVLCQRPLKLYISVGMQLSSGPQSRPRILGFRIGAILFYINLSWSCLILIWPHVTHFCCRSQMQQLLSVAATKDSPSGSKINVWTCKIIEHAGSLRMDRRWRTTLSFQVIDLPCTAKHRGGPSAESGGWGW